MLSTRLRVARTSLSVCVVVIQRVVTVPIMPSCR